MTISDMLGQSGLLTLLGMCVVFGFIIILIAFMTLLHGFVRMFKLDKEQPAETTGTMAAPAAAKDDGAVIAAIAAAIREKQSV